MAGRVNEIQLCQKCVLFSEKLHEVCGKKPVPRSFRFYGNRKCGVFYSQWALRKLRTHLSTRKMRFRKLRMPLAARQYPFLKLGTTLSVWRYVSSKLRTILAAWNWPLGEFLMPSAIWPRCLPKTAERLAAMALRRFAQKCRSFLSVGMNLVVPQGGASYNPGDE